MDDNWLLLRVMILIPLLLSLSVHEWAHAQAASWLGDQTAKYQGRLTLNPLAHIDPIGTLLLPLLGIPFGWARPVPVEPVRFNRSVSMRMGILLVAAAGPISNMCITILCLGGLFLTQRMMHVRGDVIIAMQQVLTTLVMMNVALAAFNLFPIPPLDGSRVVDSLVSDRWRPVWEAYSQAAPILLVAVCIGLPFLGFNLLQWPLELAQYLMLLVRP